LRVWWFKRKMRGQAPPGSARTSAAEGGVIEGEFRVVADDRKDE
jgi:hypothetical protein